MGRDAARRVALGAVCHARVDRDLGNLAISHRLNGLAQRREELSGTDGHVQGFLALGKPVIEDAGGRSARPPMRPVHRRAVPCRIVKIHFEALERLLPARRAS